MQTYPDMNRQIVAILREDDSPMTLYAAQRIEELEAEVKRLKNENGIRKRFMDGLPFCQDHRDKVRGKPCRECEIERLQNIVTAAYNYERSDR